MSEYHNLPGFCLLRNCMSFGEALFLAEELSFIHLNVQHSMPSIHNIFLGTIGPFERGSSIAVPLHLARLLTKERIGTLQLPVWLSESKLTELVRQEKSSKSICMRPHPAFIELAFLLMCNSQDGWSLDFQGQPSQNEASCLFEELVALRAAKIAKLHSTLINKGSANTTALSDLERRRLGIIGLDYVCNLMTNDSSMTENLEELLDSMGILDAEAHYALLEEVQGICEETLLD